MNSYFLDNSFSETSMGMHSLDPDGYIIDFNSAWGEMLGYKRSEVIGRHFTELLDDKNEQSFKEFFPKLLRQGMLNKVKYSLRAENGKYISVISDGKVSYDENGQPIKTYCTFRQLNDYSNAESDFRSILYNNPLPVLIIDPKTADIADVNAAAVQFYGYSYKELISLKVSDINIASHNRVLGYINEAVIEKKKKFRFSHKLANGSIKVIETHPSSFYIKGRKYLISFIVDVTEEIINNKKNQISLELSNKLLKPRTNIQEIADLVYDFAREITGAEAGYVATVEPETDNLIIHTLSKMADTHKAKDNKAASLTDENDIYKALFSCSLNEKTAFYTNTPSDHSHSEGTSGVHMPIDNALLCPVMIGSELVGQIALANHPKGFNEDHLEMLKEVSTIFALSIKGIRFSSKEDLFTEVFNNAADGVAVYRTDEKCENFFLTDINKSGLSSTKSEKRSIIGKNVTDIFSGVTEMGLIDVLKRVARTGQPETLEIKEYNDKTLTLQAENYVFKLSSGHLVSMFRDFTEMHRIQTELKDLNDNLMDRVHKELSIRRKQEQIINNQKKLADMGQMINAIAHQWRQPINALGLFGQHIIRHYNRGTLTDVIISDFKENHMGLISHLSNTIDDFRMFFRPDKEKSRFQVINEIAGLLKLITIQFNTRNINIKLSCKCECKTSNCSSFTDFPTCQYCKTTSKGFVGEFKQAMVNLLYNAADSIEEKKDFDRQNGLIELSVEEKGETVTITVADNGTGIPNELMEKIFDPYFTTKEDGKGTGLGLYMTKLVVENHMGGRITAQNNSKGGATFKIKLPVDSGDEEH